MSQILVGADDGNTTTNTWSVDDGHHTHMTRFQGWSVCIHINNEVQILVNKFVKEKSLLQWKQFSSERESFKIPFEQSFWVLHTATLWNDVVVVDVVYNNFILSRPILLSRERNRKTLSRKIPVSTDFSSSLSLSLPSLSQSLSLSSSFPSWTAVHLLRRAHKSIEMGTKWSKSAYLYAVRCHSRSQSSVFSEIP